MPNKRERRAEEALKKLLRKQAREASTKEEDDARARKKEQEHFHDNVKALSARLTLSEEIVATALTHPSWSIESNQKVEFLGDKVLGLIVGEHLTSHFPQTPVAALSELFNSFVSNINLNAVGKKLGIQEYIRWRPREETQGETEENKIEGEEAFGKVVANTVEAIIGGIYLEKGLRDAREFIMQHVIPRERPAEILPYLRTHAPKAALLSFLARKGEGMPYYRLLQESGRFTHKPIYIVGAFLDNKQIGVGTASSISGAEREAAQDALNKVWSEKAYPTVRSLLESKP